MTALFASPEKKSTVVPSQQSGKGVAIAAKNTTQWENAKNLVKCYNSEIGRLKNEATIYQVKRILTKVSVSPDEQNPRSFSISPIDSSSGKVEIGTISITNQSSEKEISEFMSAVRGNIQTINEFIRKLEKNIGQINCQ